MDLTTSTKDRRLYRADIGYGFSFYEKNNRIEDATGSVKWMNGKHIAVAKAFINKRNGSLFLIEEDGRNKVII